MSFPRYPSYKDSGVEWLGEVPRHWDVDRLKRSTIIVKNGIWGDEPQQDENDIPCVRVADFNRQALRVELTEPTIRNVVEKDRVGRVLSRGDLLLEKSGGGEGQPVGCVVLYDDPHSAVCSNFVARVQTAPGMNSSFWRYVHAAAYAVRLNTRSIKQTSGIQNLDASQYLDERAGFPPVAEQTQIAAFLDRETAKIDELVAEQQRLMELLKEKRQAVISHAVTQGLNPDVPMKPSGIEWLGDVPAHWEVLSLRRSIQFLTDYEANGSFADTKENVKIDDGEPYAWYVRATDLEQQRFGLVEGNRFCDKATYEWLQKTTLFGGELLVAKRGEIGKVYVMPDAECRATLAPNLYLIRLNANLTPTFAWYWFSVDPGRAELVLADKSTTIGALYKDDARSMLIVTPPVEEQVAIVKFLNRQTAKLDTLTAEAQRAIDLLQERRTALISAAVTGQIDVRQLSQIQKVGAGGTAIRSGEFNAA